MKFGVYIIELDTYYTCYFFRFWFIFLTPVKVVVFSVERTREPSGITTKRGSRSGSKNQKSSKEDQNSAYSLNSWKKAHRKSQYSCNCDWSYVGMHKI